MDKIDIIRYDRWKRKRKVDTIERNLSRLIYKNKLINNDNICKYLINKAERLNNV